MYTYIHVRTHTYTYVHTNSYYNHTIRQILLDAKMISHSMLHTDINMSPYGIFTTIDFFGNSFAIRDTAQGHTHHQFKNNSARFALIMQNSGLKWFGSL